MTSNLNNFVRLSVCPSVAYIANNSRTQRTSAPKSGRKVPHLRCDSQQDALREDYCNLRVNYTGFTVSDQLAFNTEIVSKIIHELKGGKAADIDGLTASIYCLATRF